MFESCWPKIKIMMFGSCQTSPVYLYDKNKLFRNFKIILLNAEKTVCLPVELFLGIMRGQRAAAVLSSKTSIRLGIFLCVKCA